MGLPVLYLRCFSVCIAGVCTASDWTYGDIRQLSKERTTPQGIHSTPSLLSCSFYSGYSSCFMVAPYIAVQDLVLTVIPCLIAADQFIITIHQWFNPVCECCNISAGFVSITLPLFILMYSTQILSVTANTFARNVSTCDMNIVGIR